MWDDYWFVVRKLGFSQLKLTLPGRATQSWQVEGFDAQAVPHLQAAHEISDGTVVELTAASSAMPEVLFTLLGDLASETWYKAAQRCRAMRANAQPATAAKGPDGQGINQRRARDGCPASAGFPDQPEHL